MRDDICTIPVSEVFEHKVGCPICQMKKTIEDRMVDYILGAAMMEPDVRVMTNELGFCSDHMAKMMKQRNRLSLALIMETRLDYIKDDLFKKSIIKPSAKKTAYKVAKIEETCFVCDRIEWGIERLLVTMFKTYSKEYDFRQLFKEQEYICIPHYRLLMEEAPKALEKKQLSDFMEDCNKLTKEYLISLHEDVNKFTKMFDYRNSSENADWGNSKDSIERAYAFLTSKEAD